MITLKSITSKYPKYFLVSLGVFFLTHVLLFNINTAEWGDSYRILRSAEELRMGNPYPDDEKRPPLFAILLSTRPELIDPIIYGRFVLLAFSLGSFVIFHKLLKHFVEDTRFIFLGLLLFAFNPAYLYWSLRIMADVPFSFMVLLGFWVGLNKRINSNLKPLILGIISGLSVLLRFEGYILAVSLGLGLVFNSFDNFVQFFRNPIVVIKNNLGVTAKFLIGLCFFLVPFVLYRNPLSSSYFEEPSGRSYDIKMVLVYTTSLLFIYGFTGGFGFLITHGERALLAFSRNFGISVFVVLELLLILGWPAAIPRLFVSVLPFMIIPLVMSMQDYYSFGGKKLTLIFCIGLSLIYVLAQYYLGLQFLIMTRRLILGIFLLQLPVTYFLYNKNFRLSLFFISLSCLVWSLLIIFAHRNIFISVKKGAEYAVNNLEGKVCYNDVSSVSRWYFSYGSGDEIQGVYCDMDSGKLLNEQLLIDKQATHILLTNEHNLGLEIDFSKRPYLKVLKEFRYNVNGSDFVTYVASYAKE